MERRQRLTPLWHEKAPLGGSSPSFFARLSKAPIALTEFKNWHAQILCEQMNRLVKMLENSKRRETFQRNQHFIHSVENFTALSVSVTGSLDLPSVGGRPEPWSCRC